MMGQCKTRAVATSSRSAGSRWKGCGSWVDSTTIRGLRCRRGHARPGKSAFDPRPDLAIELQPSVLHKFSDLPTGNDADAEYAIDTPVRGGRGAWPAGDPAEQPTRPKCGCRAGSPQGVPVVAANRLERLAEFENRIPKASANRRCRCFRDHQHFNRLAGLERKPLQNEIAVLADRSLPPVCLHGPIIEDLITRLSRGAQIAPVPGPNSPHASPNLSLVSLSGISRLHTDVATIEHDSNLVGHQVKGPKIASSRSDLEPRFTGANHRTCLGKAVVRNRRGPV